MYKNFLIMLLCTVSSCASAAWVKVGGNEITTVYADLETIRIEDSGVKMWNLLDLKTAKTSPTLPYLSMKSLTEYDCANVTYRFLDSLNFSANMGEGEEVYRNRSIPEWNLVPPQSAVNTLWKIACGKTSF